MPPSTRTSSMSKFMQFLPLVQWVWAGAFCVATGVGVALYNLKMDSVAMKSDLTKLQSDIAKQEKLTEENIKVLNSILSEQVKLNENMKNIHQSFIESLRNTNNKVDYTLNRLDSMNSKSR